MASANSHKESENLGGWYFPSSNRTIIPNSLPKYAANLVESTGTALDIKLYNYEVP